MGASHLTGEQLTRVPAPALPKLLQILRDVHPDPNGPQRAFFGAASWKVSVPWGRPIEPWEALFVLRDIVGCRDFGQSEKLAWECALTFKNVQLTLAHQKFGLRAYVDIAAGDEAAAAELVDGMAAALASSMPLLRKTVLTAVADEQAALGQVNVDNHYPRLSDQFDHFRQLSKASMDAADVAEPVVEERDGGKYRSISFTCPDLELRRNAEFERNAAVGAFFSFLEHLLLIAFFLSDEKAGDGRLAEFIGAGWSDKFKRVVNLADSDAKKQYDRLVKIYDAIRNPSAHGEIHSDGADFHFYLPGVGPVPTRMVTTAAGQRSYRWKLRGSLAEIWAELDDVTDWIKSGPLAGAALYGESGLALSFDEDIRSELANYRGDLDTLGEVIDNLMRMSDDAANMDW